MVHFRKLLAFTVPTALAFILVACGGGKNDLPTGLSDFSLTASPTTVALTAGGAGQALVISASAGSVFSGSIATVISGLPAGITATPASMTLTPGTAQNVILTASPTATATSANIMLTGTAGSLIHSATVALTVANPATAPVTASPDFSLALSSPVATITAGNTTGTTVTVNATAINGYTGSVSVASVLPQGVVATPSIFTLTPGTAQTLTLTAGATAPTGTYPLTLIGTSVNSAVSTQHDATLALTVNPAPATAPPPPSPDYALTIAPTAVTLTAGATTGATFAVTAAPVNGFTGNVTVTLSGLPQAVTASPASLLLAPGAPQNITLLAGSSAVAGTYAVTIASTSGALTHTATLMLTLTAAVVLPPPVTPPAPAPDYALSVTPSTASVTAGNTTGTTVVVNATPANGFTGNIAVAISGLPAGVVASPSSLTLVAGTPQNVTLTAGSSASAGTATLTFTGTSGTLAHSATLALTTVAAPLQPATVADVTTFHYDNTRQGQNTNETILTQTNVNSTTFGKVDFFAADGRIDAQPLFVANVVVNSTVTENLVYIASEHGTVYAYAAATGQQVWSTSTLGAGETTSDDHNCGQITPEIGITATPVIDRKHGAHGAIFVVGMSKDAAGAYHQRLHALDLATGAELSGSPTEIAATAAGAGDNSTNGVITFDPGKYAERAGILLLNGTIYLAWTSHCDQRPYTGWVMGYSETTLQQTRVLNLTPNGSEGAIWMAGYGMAADTSGNIYFLDANGSFSGNFNANGFPADNDYGNAMIRLSTAGGKLAVADFFQPYNTIAQSSIDSDLGSGGAMLLPDLKDANGLTRHLIIGGGKDDNLYVADRDNMGGYNQGGTSNSNLYQEISGALLQGVWAGPAYFNNTVYYAGQGDVLKAFPITKARFATTPSSVSAATFAYPGTTPTVTANGTRNAIVWAVEDNPRNPGVLHAYDATNLANELYNSNQAAGSRDAFGTGNKFITPMAINGNVYVGTPTGVAVFGLLPTP